MFQNIRKYIAVLFLLLISLFIVPKEFIHSFAGHEDTICFSHSGKAFEKQHHHCAILNFNAPLYLKVSGFLFQVSSFKLQVHLINNYLCYFNDLSNLSALRAPPFYNLQLAMNNEQLFASLS